MCGKHRCKVFIRLGNPRQSNQKYLKVIFYFENFENSPLNGMNPVDSLSCKSSLLIIDTKTDSGRVINSFDSQNKFRWFAIFIVKILKRF